MKKIFLVLLTIIFSLNLNGSYSYDENDIYKNINSIINFCESGLKVSFSTNKDLKEILNSINELDLFYLEYTLNEDHAMEDKFYFEENNDDNSIKVLIGKDKNYNVEIEIIDKENMIDIDAVKNELDKLSKDAYNFNYFTFIKGKLENQSNYELEDSLFNILDCYNVQDKSSIQLENGLTGIFTVQKTLKFNYSIMNYNNGTYLIMGSPIIFITY